MNKIIRYMLSLVMAVLTPVVVASPLADQAAKAYEQEHYQEALALYMQMEKKEGTSSQLFYNMGNTYYRLKNTSRAILYYERALLLDPTNKDARFNLDFVREKSGLSAEQVSSVYAQWLENAVGTLPSNTWAVIAAVFFLLGLAGCAMYLFLDSVGVRKLGFFGGIVMLLLSLMSYLCASHMRHRVTDRDTAIVIQEATLSKVPRQPKDSTEQAFRLPEGAKVVITDSVRTQQTLWLDVKASKGHNAWIQSTDVEII